MLRMQSELNSVKFAYLRLQIAAHYDIVYHSSINDVSLTTL